jgi:hypothetical protein
MVVLDTNILSELMKAQPAPAQRYGGAETSGAAGPVPAARPPLMNLHHHGMPAPPANR